MGFIYFFQICEISHQTFGPSNQKCLTCPMIFINTVQMLVPYLYWTQTWSSLYLQMPKHLLVLGHQQPQWRPQNLTFVTSLSEFHPFVVTQWYHLSWPTRNLLALWVLSTWNSCKWCWHAHACLIWEAQILAKLIEPAFPWSVSLAESCIDIRAHKGSSA